MKDVADEPERVPWLFIPAARGNSNASIFYLYYVIHVPGEGSVIRNLSFEELMRLFRSVFALKSDERNLTFLVDLPNEIVNDNAEWHDRRRMAAEWYVHLSTNANNTPFRQINLCTYTNVGSNNNDLPPVVTRVSEFLGDASPASGIVVSLDEILASSGIVIALTQFSATAPLKLLAKRFQFRGASMPGFLRSMLPTLSINYEEVHARVVEFKEKMERAEAVRVTLSSNGTTYTSLYDLRFRPVHASGGLIREPGIVGNLPSGEAYIAPYEGERNEEPSRTSGLLPVQFNDEVVVYRISNNRAVEVISSGKYSGLERSKLKEEPAYGNIAEVGLGVLGEWGVQPVGSILLDEKLGQHIAFGRSEHFGGITSPSSFNNPKNVVHIDRVYVPSLQPKISVEEVTFLYSDAEETVMRKGKYSI